MVGMAELAVCQFGRRDFRQLPALILPGADCHIGAHDEPRGRCSRIAIITLEIDAGHQTILSSIISTPGIGETPSIGRNTALTSSSARARRRDFNRTARVT